MMLCGEFRPTRSSPRFAVFHQFFSVTKEFTLPVCKRVHTTNFAKILLAWAAMTGCKSSLASDTSARLPLATAISESAVSELALDLIDSIHLASIDSMQIGRVTHFMPTPFGYIVIDGMKKRVLAFDQRGALVAQVGRSGTGLDEYEDPYRAAVRGDSIFVLDLARFSHVLAFDRSRSYVGGIDWKNERMPTDLLLTSSGMFVTTTVKKLKGSIADVLHLVDQKGASIGTGCRVDPRILESDRDQGMLGSLVFASLSVLGDRIYCAQATTPIVQVVDTLGRAHTPITIMPPFYVAPVDRPLTMNSKHMMAFNASFTTHVAFVPTRSGFVSIYSKYDTTAQQTKYYLFACDSAKISHSCGTHRSDRRILQVTSPDTVYVEESSTGSGTVIGRYRLRLVTK